MARIDGDHDDMPLNFRDSRFSRPVAMIDVFC